MNKIRFYETFGEIFGTGQPTFSAFKTLVQANCKLYDPLKPINPRFEDVYNILVNRHWTDYVAHTDYYASETIDENFAPVYDLEPFFRQFFQVYLSTIEKYNQLFDFYNSYKSHLMDRLGNETKAKYNDTPQNGGDFDNDDHLSTITTTTTEQDVQPLIQRLADIDRLYKKLMSDWADEFKPLFLEPGDCDYD